MGIFQQGAVEIFELPVGATPDVEHPVGGAAAIDHDKAPVVGGGGFGGSALRGGGDRGLIELDTGAGGPPIKVDVFSLIVAKELGGLNNGSLGSDGVEGAHGDPERLAGNAATGEADAEGNRRVVESGLAEGSLGDAQITQRGGFADDDGIERRQAGWVGEGGREVGGIAIGEEEHAGERLGGKAFADAGQGVTEVGAGAGEVEGREIADAA